jgi:hypothetical protein
VQIWTYTVNRIIERLQYFSSRVPGNPGTVFLSQLLRAPPVHSQLVVTGAQALPAKGGQGLIWCQSGSVLAKEPVPSSPTSNSSLLSHPLVTPPLLHPLLSSSNLKLWSHEEVGELFRHPQLNHLFLELLTRILDRLVLPVSFKDRRASSSRTPRTPPNSSPFDLVLPPVQTSLEPFAGRSTFLKAKESSESRQSD